MDLQPIQVYYWKMRGRGSIINHFLAALNVPFEVNYFTAPPEWIKKKMEILPTYPLANLPLIQDPNNGGQYVAESGAIMQYLARNYGPEAGATSLEEVEQIWELFNCLLDLNVAIARPLFQVSDAEAFKEKLDAGKMRVKSKLALLENVLSKDDWLFKNRFTFADALLGFMTEVVLAFEKDFAFEYLTEGQRKALSGHLDRLLALEGVKKWRASDKFFEKPYIARSYTFWKQE